MNRRCWAEVEGDVRPGDRIATGVAHSEVERDVATRTDHEAAIDARGVGARDGGAGERGRGKKKNQECRRGPTLHRVLSLPHRYIVFTRPQVRDSSGVGTSHT